MADTTFITNEGENNLENLFKQLIKNTRFFDCLVGYFYPSGFFRLYKELESVDKIRILIGIGTSQQTIDMLSQARTCRTQLQDTSFEIKKEIDNKIVSEYETTKESEMDVEEGTRKFIEWISSGKMEIRAYPESIHSKLYVFTSKGGGFGDDGRVISGSSNLTESGLRGRRELNHVLKSKEDYEYSLKYFEDYWNSSIDVSDRFVQTISTKTWINSDISPNHLFLKFLYEYLRERIDEDQVKLTSDKFRPKNFIEFKYQTDAVKEAKEKLLEYGGVFIADVVGLGKTYIATMLAKELEMADGGDAGTLVIAPPVLLDENNPGSWKRAFNDFGVSRREFCSRGKLEDEGIKLAKKVKTVIIDESHGFRNESTQMYEYLYRICKGKRIILVSATPLNNTPMDILAQLKLFQNVRRSTFPSPEVRDLESFFKKLQSRLNGLDRQINKEEYLEIIKKNSQEIRQKVLRHVMIRRTRASIVKYYGKDLEKQGLKFPIVEDPKQIIYQFDKKLDGIFNQTVEAIINKFHYARYKPLTYMIDQTKLTNLEKGAQQNMGTFMKGILLKRLESSFFAFKNSINRFIYSYEIFIKAYNGGHVYFSKKNINKILECLDSGDEDKLQSLLDGEKAKDYPRYDGKGKEQFKKNFITELEEDLETLRKIKKEWEEIDHDPKLEEFIKRLNSEEVLKKNKIIVFTESKETAEYLERELTNSGIKQVKSFSSFSEDSVRREVIENFDARGVDRKTIRVLITTDILAEGVNLHRSNVVINYDIPWNPIKMMQRVGRVNRVDSKHERIYTYNFFPAGPVNESIKLTEAAEAKINAFIEMLGNDAKLLTDEEIKSHDLFLKLNSPLDEGESDDAELKWLIFLRDIRDHNPELYEKIKKLPKKARTGREVNYLSENGVLTFFRKGKLKKIFLTCKNDIPKELDLTEAVDLLNCPESTKNHGIGRDYYEFVESNKEAFDDVFEQEVNMIKGSGRSNEYKLIINLRDCIKKNPEILEEDLVYLNNIIDLVNGGMDANKIKKLANQIVKGGVTEPQKILCILKDNIEEEYFQKNPVSSADISGPKEVILSEYFIGGNK